MLLINSFKCPVPPTCHQDPRPDPSKISCIFAENKTFSELERNVTHCCIGVFQHIDHYSRTKAIAEQMVLSANRSFLKGVCNDSMMTELHVKMGYKQRIFANLAWF